MEQETMLKEILNALKLHAEHVDNRFNEMNNRFVELDRRFDEMDRRFDAVDKRFEEVDKRFNRLETKVDGNRMDQIDTQRTTHFLLRKVADHDEKLLEHSQQQK